MFVAGGLGLLAPWPETSPIESTPPRTSSTLRRSSRSAYVAAMQEQMDRETTSKRKSRTNTSSIEATRAQGYHDLICGYKQRRGARWADDFGGYSETFQSLEARRDDGLHGRTYEDKRRRENPADLFESDEETIRRIEERHNPAQRRRPSVNNRRRKNNRTDHFEADIEAVHPAAASPVNQQRLAAVRRVHFDDTATTDNPPFAQVATPGDEQRRDPLATGPAHRLQEARDALNASMKSRHVEAATEQAELTRQASTVTAEYDQLRAFDRLKRHKTPAEHDAWFTETNGSSGISVSGRPPTVPAYSPLRERGNVTTLPTIEDTGCKRRGTPPIVPVYSSLRKRGKVTPPQTIENTGRKAERKTIGRLIKKLLCLT